MAIDAGEWSPVSSSGPYAQEVTHQLADYLTGLLINRGSAQEAAIQVYTLRTA